MHSPFWKIYPESEIVSTVKTRLASYFKGAYIRLILSLFVYLFIPYISPQWGPRMAYIVLFPSILPSQLCEVG